MSNLPEAVGSATAMRAAGRRPAAIRRLWVVVALICTLATVAGYAIADATSGDLQAAIDGFAAGALLVMLIDSMIPDARPPGGRCGGSGDGARLRRRRGAFERQLSARIPSAPTPQSPGFSSDTGLAKSALEAYFLPISTFGY